jgi:hydroxyacylglutathione hydrolase
MLMTKMFEVGRLSTNCYVPFCSDTLDAVVIDPGFDTQNEAEEIFAFIKENKLTVNYVIDTHGHPDHTCGNAAIKNRYHAPICIHEKDAYMLGETGKETALYFGYDCVSPAADVLLKDGSIIEFGNCALRVADSPGHSEGSMILVGGRVVFSGDTLFAGSIGRTDFPGSSDGAMQASLRKLKGLGDSLTVYPGHGPATTLGVEKRVNPFLLGL